MRSLEVLSSSWSQISATVTATMHGIDASITSGANGSASASACVYLLRHGLTQVKRRSMNLARIFCKFRRQRSLSKLQQEASGGGRLRRQRKCAAAFQQ